MRDVSARPTTVIARIHLGDLAGKSRVAESATARFDRARRDMAGVDDRTRHRAQKHKQNVSPAASRRAADCLSLGLSSAGPGKARGRRDWGFRRCR